MSGINIIIRFSGVVCFVGVLPLLFGANVVGAQSPKPGAVTMNYLEAGADDYGQTVVSAYVSVVSDTGQPLTNLQSDNFVVMEDGVEMFVDSVTVANDPITIILVMDTSGSMAAVGANGQMAIEAAKQAAVSFVSGLSPEDQASVYSFNDDVTLQQDLSLDHNAAINAINSLNYKDFGGTCLYDAAAEAVKKSAEIQQGRRAILVLTDGVDEAGQSANKSGACSVSTLDDVIDKATQTTLKVPIFTIGFGNVDEQALQRIARRTAGHSLIANDASELTSLFNIIAAQLKNQYLITYQTQTVSGEHAVVVKAQMGNGYESDERRVFIPPSLAEPVIEAPPSIETLPQISVTIDAANQNQPLEGELEIIVGISQPEQVIETALYVNDGLEQKLQEPPFDRFILNMDELAPGQHMLRVEVIDSSGQLGIARRELDISAPPTFGPETETALVPPPEPTPVPGIIPAEIDPRLAILGAAACVILLIALGTAAFFLMRRKKNNIDISSAPEELRTFITGDDEGSLDPYETMDSEDPDVFKTYDGFVQPLPPAWLDVVSGVNIRPGQKFNIQKKIVTVGRNEGGGNNDIDLPEQAVSRKHAEIRFDGANFSIKDRGSSYRTYVNSRPLPTEQWEILRDGDEVRFGSKTVMRFGISSTTAGNANFQNTAYSGYGMDPNATEDDIEM